MEVKEKLDRNGLTVYYYSDVDPKYLTFKKGDRVLPAPLWNDKKQVFTFSRYYDPGEHNWWPLGGFELRGPGGEFRAFDIDQVILHPSIFEHEKRINKIRKRQEKDEIKKQKLLDKKRKKLEKKVTKGKRGRPVLTEEEKLLKKAERLIDPNKKQRGRKALDPEIRLQREAEKLAKRMLSGSTGKRGRPPGDPAKKAEREAEAAVRKLKSGGKRGRPKTK